LYTTVVPFIAAEARLFHAWKELVTTLASNVKEWGKRFEKEADGSGEQKLDRKIEFMYNTLTNLRTAAVVEPMFANPLVEDSNPLAAVVKKEVIKEARPSIDSQEEAGGPATEPCSEPSCPEAREAAVALIGQSACCEEEQLAPRQGPPQPFVREIRRWREATGTGPGQQRELVLLYVVSDDIVTQTPAGQPVLFRYAVQAETSSMTGTTSDGPSPDLENLTLTKVGPGPGQPALPAAASSTASQSPSRRPSGSTVATQLTQATQFSTASPAQASLDSVAKTLDQNKFDMLLGAVLEDLPDLLQSAKRKNSVTESDQAKPPPGKSMPMKNFMNKVRPSLRDQKAP